MLKRTLIALTLSQFILSGCVAPVVAAGAGTANVAGSSRSIGTQVDDIKIEADIDTILDRLSPQLKGSSVEHTTFNGIVLLLGQVPSFKLKQRIAKEVAQIKGVDVVYNQMTIGRAITLGKFTKDVWITTKVKTLLADQVNPLHFKVVTESSVVYLMGRVTPDEADQAVQIAKGVKGVKKVVRIFSYLYPQKGPAEAEVVPVDQKPHAAASSAEVGPDASD